MLRQLPFWLLRVTTCLYTFSFCLLSSPTLKLISVLKVCGFGSLIVEKSWWNVGLVLTAKALWIDWADVAKLFGFGGNTLPVIFNGVSIIGVSEWRPQSIDVTSLVFSHFKKLNRNIFVPSDTKVTIGANVQNNSGSKMATQIQVIFINQSSGDNKPIA